MLALNWSDRLVALFCGSTNSLATGPPVAKVMFPYNQLAQVVLPLMLYHLLQLAVLAVWSRRAVLRV